MCSNEVKVSFQVSDKYLKLEIVEYAEKHNIGINGSVKGFNGIDAIQLIASVATMIQFVDWIITKTKGKRNILIRYSSEKEEYESLTMEQLMQVLDKENNIDRNESGEC